jgi:hypothetical protein
VGTKYWLERRNDWPRVGAALSLLEWIAAFLLTAAAAAVQFVRVSHAGPLWRDEAGALAIAQLPDVRAMLRWFPHEAFPLAFPLTLRGWLTVGGDSDVSLRWFGAAVAVLLIAALWLNARVAGTLPFASIALFVLSPLALLIGAIRGYGLASAAIVLAIAAHAQIVERVDRRRLVIAAAASLFAAHVALHDAALLLAIGLAAAAVVLRSHGWRPAVAILGADAVAALSLAMYIDPLTAARQWDRLLVADVTWRVITGSFASSVGHPGIVALYAGAALAGIVTAVLALREKPSSPMRDRRLFYLLCLPLMLVSYGVWLQVLNYVPRIWYFVPLLAGSAACLDGLFASPARSRTRFALMACAIAAGGWLLPQTWRVAHVRSTNIDLVAAELTRVARPDDLIVVNPWFFGVSFARYYRGPAPWTTFPPLSDHRVHRYDLVMAYMTRQEGVGPAMDDVAAILRRGGTVWLVGFFEPPAPGTQPLSLAPAPDPAFGWAEAPYLYSWAQQLAVMLAREGVLRRDEVLMTGPTSGFEAVPLREFRSTRVSN